MMNENKDIIKQIKKFFKEETVNKNSDVKKFSDNVIKTAYEKLSTNLIAMIQAEEDPIVLSELLMNYLQVSKAVDECGLQRQQLLLKLFEQLTKYEQNRYY